LSQPVTSGSGGCGATCRHPGTLRLQPQSFYPDSISRWPVVAVKTHTSNVLAKLGLRDRVQAVIFAYKQNIIDA
jgi:hypothetical protein